MSLPEDGSTALESEDAGRSGSENGTEILNEQREEAARNVELLERRESMSRRCWVCFATDADQGVWDGDL